MIRKAHPSSDSGGDQPARVHDAGFSLIEVVIAVTLMAVVIVPILVAMSTALSESARSRQAAQAETLIVNIADRLNRAPKSCGYDFVVSPAMQMQKWPTANASTAYWRWVPAATAGQPGQWVSDPDGCELDAPTPLLVQKVRVTIQSPDGKVRRSIEVVKSDV